MDGGKRKIFVCNLSMTLDELGLHICSRIGLTLQLLVWIWVLNMGSWMNGQFLAYLIDDDEALDAMSDGERLIWYRCHL